MNVRRFGVLTLLACGLLITSRVGAQQAGDTIIFALPAGTDVTTGPEGDKVIYTGRPIGFVDAQNCASDPELKPVRAVTLVDAGSGTRATRSQAMVTISINGDGLSSTLASIKNGTRIGNLVGPEDCVVGGVAYQRYSGTVE